MTIFKWVSSSLLATSLCMATSGFAADNTTAAPAATATPAASSAAPAAVPGSTDKAFLAVDQNAPDAPTALLKEVSDRLIDRLSHEKEQIKKDAHLIIDIVDTIIMPITDFNLIAKRVLGRHWRDANAQQQQQFLKEFKLLLIVTYIAAFRSYENQTVDFKRQLSDPSDPSQVEVKTLIQEPGAPPIPVNYRLHKNADTNNYWLVFDFNVDGVGLTSSFRAQFDEAITQKGMNGMLADMRKKNEEVFGKE